MDEFTRKNIINSLIDVMNIAVQNSSHNQSGVRDLHGSLRYFSGCEFPFFNGVFNNYNNQASYLKDNLASITQFFSEKNTPFIWWWLQDSEIPHDIKFDLDANGFQCLGDYLGIAASLDQVNLDLSPSTIKITNVVSKDEYSKFLEIICSVFQLSDSVKIDLGNMYQSYGPNGKFTHYLALHENEPIATVTSYVNGKVVGLYNGATLPNFQKKGACTILIKNVIKEAMSKGCEYAVAQLMAPGMAKGLTEKIGFKHYCTLLPFLKDPRVSVSKY